MGGSGRLGIAGTDTLRTEGKNDVLIFLPTLFARPFLRFPLSLCFESVVQTIAH